MKILFINEVCGTGSTGKICCDLADTYISKGYKVVIAYGRNDYVPQKYKNISYRIGNYFDVNYHALYTRLTDKHGLASKCATKRFLKWAETYNPDELWLHNLHGYYINYEMLFEWIKKRPSMKVYWTLHDCWAFTGHCVHFTAIGCTQWKNCCKECAMKKDYPKSLFISNCKENYIRKRNAFTGVKQLTIVTPSNWLKKLVEQSILKDYPIQVHPNTVDAHIFKKVVSSFKKNNKIEDKIIVLGVANNWDERKGYSIFKKLSRLLDDRYKIVMVGLTKEQLGKLPRNIIGIEHTNNLNELVDIYSDSDIFLNPSIEETFGMTTVEAMMCGCKAIVMKGSACEEIAVPLGGVAVKRDLKQIYKAIKQC